MIREALRIALMMILKNHTYEFNYEIRTQQKGGPIGVDLTGIVAKIYMKWWDRQLDGRLRQHRHQHQPIRKIYR